MVRLTVRRRSAATAQADEVSERIVREVRLRPHSAVRPSASRPQPPAEGELSLSRASASERDMTTLSGRYTRHLAGREEDLSAGR